MAAFREERHPQYPLGDAGAEVTIAGRAPDKLLQAPQELGQVHTIVMDMTKADAVEKGFAGLRSLDHVLISDGTIRPSPMDTMTSLRQVR